MKATPSLSSTDWTPPPGARELADGKLLLDEPADDVARLTISNPSKRNALDHPILDALTQALLGLDARCVVLTAAHGMFSAGYDIGDMPEDKFAEQATPPPTRRSRWPATRRSSASCWQRGGDSTLTRSASWSSCAVAASCPRTSARACARSGKSARRAGRGASPNAARRGSAGPG